MVRFGSKRASTSFLIMIDKRASKIARLTDADIWLCLSRTFSGLASYGTAMLNSPIT